MFKDGDLKHYLIRKYHAYFGALFSNVHIDRNVQSNGELSARFKVPLHFGKVEHALERVIEDPTIDRPDAIVLPALSWDFLGMKYSPSRHIPTRNRFVYQSSDPSKANVLHTPAPYDFAYQLGILVKNYDDGLKIVEEIVTYFQPDYTTKLELIPEVGLVQEIPVVLESVDMDYQVPDDYKTRVSFVWTLNFVLQGYLYGPEKLWPLIKFANIDLGIAPNITVSDFSTNTVVVIATVSPGLTANGQPTSNAALSVNALSIPLSANYGYIETSNTIHGSRT